MPHDVWEKATVNADRPWAPARARLRRNAPPGVTVEMGADGKPVLRRRRKTIDELRAELETKRATWYGARRYIDTLADGA